MFIFHYTVVSVMFNESSYVVTEGGSVMVCAEVMGSLEQQVEVNVTLSPGTATGAYLINDLIFFFIVPLYSYVELFACY